ncbi:hypothetical protein CRE_19100 [Caenorhabditis remanei]|uniref:Uncharacterized protein n=1 Tax=Caenorhabditis remanei TaxID=31234 RepID=E3MJB7_CAERE|nr:hypothetical protein CRE_19100 [Caenorhabditis remanei]
MLYRTPTSADLTSLLEMYGCSAGVVVNVVHSLDMVLMFLKFKSFSRVACAYTSEYQFFENHVLQDEIPFVDFFNGLLDRLEIKGDLAEEDERSELEQSEKEEEEDEDDADDEYDENDEENNMADDEAEDEDDVFEI